MLDIVEAYGVVAYTGIAYIVMAVYMATYIYSPHDDGLYSHGDIW